MADSAMLDLDRFVLKDVQYERYHYYKYSSILNLFPDPKDTSESSFSSGGGWIAIYQENISRTIYIFSPNGEHVLNILWDLQDPLICIGWIHNDDTLLALDSSGIYRIYSDIRKDHHSQASTNMSCHYTQFSLNIPAECFILDAQIIPDNDYLIARVNKDNGRILFYGVDLLDIPKDFIIEVPSRSTLDEEIGTILWTGFPISSTDQPRGFQCIVNHDRIDSTGQSLISLISIEHFHTPEIIIYDKVLDSLEHESITHLALSPNHQYLAIFQRPGLLTILLIQSKPTLLDIVCHAVVVEELEQFKLMDMSWCGNDAIVLISSFALLLIGTHGGTTKIFMKSHFYAFCDSLSNGLVIWTPNTFELVRKVPEVLVNCPNQTSVSLVLEALDLYSKKDPHSHMILSQLSENYEKDDNGNMKSLLYITLSSCLDIFQETLSNSLKRRMLEAWYLGFIYLDPKNPLYETMKRKAKNVMKQFHLIEIMRNIGIPINYSALEYYFNHLMDALVHRLCNRRSYSVAESAVYICKSQKSRYDSLKYIFMDWLKWHIEILLEPEQNTDALPSMIIEYLVESILMQLDRCFSPSINIWIQMIKLSFELHRVSLSIRLYEKLREKFSSISRNEIEPLMVYMASVMERMDIAIEYAISTDDLPLAKKIIQCTVERIQYRIHRQSSLELHGKNSHQHESYFPVFSCLNRCPSSFKRQFIILYEKSDPELVRSFYYQDDQYTPYISSLIQEATSSDRKLSSNLVFRALQYAKDSEGRISKYMIKVI